jgi:peptidoglycan hydrolase CwlO-like protein
MSENNDAILQAMQTGFANIECQFTDLLASNSRIESRLANLEAEVAEIKTKLAKVENRMHTVDLRLNGVDSRLIDFSDDIRGLQTQQNRVSEYIFNRPQ